MVFNMGQKSEIESQTLARREGDMGYLLQGYWLLRCCNA